MHLIPTSPLLAVLAASLLAAASGHAQQHLWSEDFTGINGPLIDTATWNGVVGLTNNNSLRNHNLIGNDDALGFGFPAAHKFRDGFYSGGGTVYAELPATSVYQLTGNLIDFGTGSDRTSNTSVFVESEIAADHSLVRTGWEFRLVRYSDSNSSMFDSIQVYAPDGTQVINQYLFSAPSSPQLIPFSFERNGDTVRITVRQDTNQRVFDTSETYSSNHNDLVLQHRISGFGKDATKFGWNDLLMVDPTASPGQSFDDWRAVHFLPDELDDLSVSGPDANPSGDGLPNLLKYALGLDPKQFAAPEERPVSTIAENHLTISFQPNSEATDANVTVEVSPDLVNWFTGPEHVEEVAGASADSAVVIRDLATTSEANRRFLRLRASMR